MRDKDLTEYEIKLQSRG